MLLGTECAGVVEAVGSGVSYFQPGDEVVALANPAFASHTVVPQAFVAPKPAVLNFAQAACALIGPMTAWYGLMEAHLHPALALVPIVPLIPGPSTDTGLFVEEDEVEGLEGGTGTALSLGHLDEN